MENLPIDAIDLASRIFYSESEDKIYFGDPINGYFEVNTGQLAQVAFSGSYNDLDDKPTIPAVIFNQNPLNAVTVSGTTTPTTLLDVSSGTLTLSEKDLEVGKTYEFQIYGRYTSYGDDFKFRFGVGTTYVEVNIPISGMPTDRPFRIICSLDIVAVGGNPNARFYYFSGVIVRERSTAIIYEYPIVGNESVDDVTLGSDFTFSVVPTDNSSSFTCIKAILKRLN